MNVAKSEVALSAKRFELFARMLSHKGISVTNRQILVRRAMHGPIPLSYAQQRLWFLNQLEPGNFSYNVPLRMRLTGRLDVEVLTQTLNEVIRRHEALRTTFSVIDGQPVQVIAATHALRLPVLDLSALVESERMEAVTQIVTEEARHLFDLSNELSLRVRLLRLGAEEHLVLLTMHHIISDGWSTAVLIRELEALYRAFAVGQPSPLPELSIQYADYAVWQRESLQEKTIKQQLSYWKQHLAGAPSVLELPTDRPRPPIQSSRGAREYFELPSALIEKLKALCEQHDVTLFMMLLGAFQVLLMRYTGQERISVGSPIAGRNNVETEKLIGLFAYTLVLHTDLRGDPSFTELLKRVRETALGAYSHQDVPFEKLVEELQPERSLSHSPLFQVMFILQNVPQQAMEIEGLRLEEVKSEGGTANYDLTLSLVERNGALRGAWEYNADLFDGETLRRMAGHLQRLMESIVDKPEQLISRLPILTESEQQQFEEWNSTKREYDSDHCLHVLFEAQVKRTPESVALVFGNERLSYAELEARANQLARHLRNSGVGAEVRVGILMDRSVEMVVGLLGVLKAGGAYVPLDPQYPQERLTWMLEDAAVAVLLTAQKYAEWLGPTAAHIVCMESEEATIGEQSKEPLEVAVAADNLAYVIYTSGSTGRPKGVAISHRSASMLIHWALECFSAADLAGVLASTSICFDLSVFELFVPLSGGGKVVLAESALLLATLPAAREVTLINTVPSAFAELLRGGDVPETVRTVNLAGEVLSHRLAREVYRQEHIAALYNLYGPTEDTTYSTYTLVPFRCDESPTIGRPVANTEAYVLDRHLRVVPIGVAGELWLGGAGLARGYLNRPDLTAERFMPHPFGHEAGGRLYKTGDLARYRSDGEMEYIGRTDQQVKIRGFRIELGEIEAALERHPSVREAVVIAREDNIGEKRLVAYLAATEESAAGSVSELRGYLKKQLPEYMVPALFVMLSELPQTPNGKVDRNALPAPSGARPDLEREYVAPRNELEQQVAAIWQELLRVEQVGIHDNFFDLGGHSLLTTQVILRVRDRLHVEVPLRDFFETPTVNGLALAIRASQVRGR
jgi:amino acid adenylation domain-containing protein